MDFNIKDYIKKFETLLPDEVLVRNAIIQTIEDILKISLQRQKITYSRGVIKILVPSVIKSEITLKKAKILDIIRMKIPTVFIKDIQ